MAGGPAGASPGLEPAEAPPRGPPGLRPPPPRGRPSGRGRQLVSADWVAEATRSHVEASGAGEGYGYLWWVDEADGSPSYRAWGYGGQLLEVVPERDLVVVVVSDVDLTGARSRLTPDLFDYLVDEIVAPRFAL